MYHSISVREQIVKEKLTGRSLTALSKEYSISYSTTKRIWQSYQKGGFENIKPKYSNCGPKGIKYYKMYRRSIWLKKHHPSWGAPYILTQIEDKYPTEALPSIRTVQKWFQSNHLNRPKIQREHQQIEPVQDVHDCWQIDAKENIDLLDDTKACYLTMVDTKSGAVLATPVFPPRSN